MGADRVFSQIFKGNIKGAMSEIKTPFGQGINSIFKRAAQGADKEDKASIAAGNADADSVMRDRQAAESRRRSYLGLNNTGPRGVASSLSPTRSRLGGY